MFRKYWRAVTAVLLFILLMLVSCSRKAPQADVRSEVFYSYFDTVSEISSYAGDSEDAFRKNAASVSALLERWHRMLDIYHEYDGMNNLCTVNMRAGGEPVPVDRELIDFVLYAKDMCTLTSGEMDISLGAVLRLWHEARNAEASYLPSDEQLSDAFRHVGFDRLEIDTQACTLRLSDSLASLDPGALGKGYAAEKAARMLISEGITGYVINLGGNIRCIGTKADGSPWITGIRDPENPEKLAVTLKISDCSCVTSGGYERFFTVNGVRYAHIIDKDTLYPAVGFSSVSVVCKDSALADTLSTALFCMSYEDGLSLVSSLDDVQALWILDDGSLRYTKGFGLAILKT